MTSTNESSWFPWLINNLKRVLSKHCYAGQKIDVTLMEISWSQQVQNFDFSIPHLKINQLKRGGVGQMECHTTIIHSVVIISFLSYLLRMNYALRYGNSTFTYTYDRAITWLITESSTALVYLEDTHWWESTGDGNWGIVQITPAKQRWLD
jgi:hypothetical protein